MNSGRLIIVQHQRFIRGYPCEWDSINVFIWNYDLSPLRTKCQCLVIKPILGNIEGQLEFSDVVRQIKFWYLFSIIDNKPRGVLSVSLEKQKLWFPGGLAVSSPPPLDKFICTPLGEQIFPKKYLAQSRIGAYTVLILEKVATSHTLPSPWYTPWSRPSPS